MSRPEDKSCHSLRTLSEKPASENHGSIISYGGIFAKKNIVCNEEIVAGNLIIKGTSKIAGDMSIGGTLYCPDVYYLDEDVIRIKRNLVPGLLKHPVRPDEKANLGTVTEPWDLVCTQKIQSKIIEVDTINAGTIKAGTINAGTIETCYFPRMAIGKNKFGTPSLEAQTGEINISDNLNIVNPDTNIIMLT